MTRSLVFAAALLLASSTALAASFDCKLAKSPQEHAICNNPQLNALDDELGATYKRLLSASSPQEAAHLRAEEAAWLRSVALACHATATSQPQGDLAACLTAKYQARLGELQNTPQTRSGIRFLTRTKSFTAPILPADRLPNADQDETTLHASWPQAVSTDPAWQAWNTAIEQQVKSLSRPDGDPHPDWNVSWAKGVDADVRAEIAFLDDRLITTHIENDLMGYGAAHPSEVWTNLTWLRQEKRPLAVNDVFRPGNGWTAVVTKHCVTGLAAQNKASNGTVGYGGKMEADALAKVIVSPDNWVLDETGLTISFPEYTVSPRYATPEPITVPWSALGPFLGSTFVRPHGKATLVGGEAGGY